MKLNKPPVNEEQSILEEYVDFLLTDLSNVTPIHSKQTATKERTNLQHEIGSSDKALQQNDFNLDPHQSSHSALFEKEKDYVQKKPAKPSNQALVDGLPIESKTKEPADSNKLPVTDNINCVVSASKEAFNQQEDFHSDDRIKQPFVLESEEEELKKWDAVLTKEKEALFLSNAKGEPGNNSGIEIPAESSLSPSGGEKITEQDQSYLKNEQNASHRLQPENELTKELKKFDHEPDKRLIKVEKLLARISPVSQPDKKIDATNRDIPETDSLRKQSTEAVNETAEASFQQRQAITVREMLPEVFQTLIFEVGKLPLAVPLLKLGGIVPVSEQEITPLVGTPDWFMGLVPHDRGNLMVIDTQQYLMPEQRVADSERSEYEYLILLDDTNWAMACHGVGDAKNLTQDDIRWSQKSSQRPWFGGMVVDYMSALIEVDELINMLSSHISE